MSFSFVCLLFSDCVPGRLTVGCTYQSPSEFARDSSSRSAEEGSLKLLAYFEMEDAGKYKEDITGDYEMSPLEAAEFIATAASEAATYFVCKSSLRQYVEIYEGKRGVRTDGVFHNA